jgi:replicative DNA helicase
MNSHQSPPELIQNNCTDTTGFLELLHKPGSVFEIRSIDCPDRVGGSFKATASGYFDDPIKAADVVGKLESRKPPAVYVTLNPVDPALIARANNRMIHRAKSTTQDAEIVRRRWLFIDIDSKRPAGISATDSEVQAAIDLAGLIRDELRSIGWPDPIAGMSGNGGYLLYRVDLPNDDDSKVLIKSVLKSLAGRFDSDAAVVDCSTFNAARIIKLLGTIARKGDDMPERPHRKSWFNVPDGSLDVVPVELLRDVAAWADPDEKLETKSEQSDFESSSSSILDRASKYLATMKPSVSGSKGHDRLLIAAGTLVRGFNLSDAEACQLLDREFNPRCVPQWAAHEINHKISEARANGKPFGYLLDGSSSAKTDWDDPVDIERPKLPEFPLDSLSGAVGHWVAAASYAFQVPIELPGLLALSAVSGMIARRVEVVAGRGWREPVNLYVCCLLEPANRKSAVFRAAFKPIQAIERELIQREAPEVARQQSDRRCQEKQLAKLEGKAASGDADAMREAGDLAVEIASNPITQLPKLWMDDSTSEAVEIQLAAQCGRMIVAGAEGGLFDTMAGRYSSGVGNFDCFLKGHAGDDLRVDRVGRGSLVVDRCCLTLAYAVQPDVIRGLAGKPSFRGRGLIGRFLYALPENNLGNRAIDPEPMPGHVIDRYDRLMRRLSEIRPTEDGPHLLNLADDADSIFKDWQRESESMLRDDGRLASMRDWGGKLNGMIARLSAVLHCVKVESEPWNVPIDAKTIQSAIEIGRWAIDHAEAAIGLMAADDGRLDDAAYCLRFIRSRGEPQVSRRDIGQHGRARFDNDPSRLDRALDVLVDRGWLRPVDSDRGAGRPSVRFDVNPKAIERDRGVV